MTRAKAPLSRGEGTPLIAENARGEAPRSHSRSTSVNVVWPVALRVPAHITTASG